VGGQPLPLGADSRVGEGRHHGREAQQCPRGDGVREARIPRRVSSLAMHCASQRFFRMEGCSGRWPHGKAALFHPPWDENALFEFTGLSERWLSPDCEEIHSCCIITTEANALMMPIHNRMPVVLAPGDYDAWLDPAHVNAEMLRALLYPAAADDMIAYPVSRAVNSSRTDAPMLVEPA